MKDKESADSETSLPMPPYATGRGGYIRLVRDGIRVAIDLIFLREEDSRAFYNSSLMSLDDSNEIRICLDDIQAGTSFLN